MGKKEQLLSLVKADPKPLDTAPEVITFLDLAPRQRFITFTNIWAGWSDIYCRGDADERRVTDV